MRQPGLGGASEPAGAPGWLPAWLRCLVGIVWLGAGCAGPGRGAAPTVIAAWPPLEDEPPPAPFQPLVPVPPPVTVAREWPDGAGTALVLVEDHRVPLVELVLDLPAGRRSPWFRRVHAEEAFEIQLHDRSGALRLRADQLAVQLRLHVEDDHTELRLRCLKEDLGPALDLLRDVLRGADFDRAELRRRRLSRGPGWAALGKLPMARLRREVELREYVAGDPRRLDAEPPPRLLANPAQLAAARDALLRLPGRAIGFAGDVTPAEVARLGAGLLPAVGPAPADLLPRWPLVRAAGGDGAVRLPGVNQVYLAYRRSSLGDRHRDYPAFLLASEALAGPGNMGSRLWRALRTDGALTYDAAGAETEDFAPGTYYLRTYTRVADADAIERGLREVVRRFHETGLTEEERAAAVEALRGRRALRHQSPGQLLSQYLFERRHGLPAGFEDQLADRAAALPLPAINAFIQRFFDPARFRMLRLTP